MNKKNLKLNDEETTGVGIFGIVCQENDVRMCWLTGQATGMLLTRARNFDGSENTLQPGFARYTCHSDPEEAPVVLLQNKTGNKVLYGNARQFDYLLIIPNTSRAYAALPDQLRSIPEVQAVYSIEQSALKGISEVIALY